MKDIFTLQDELNKFVFDKQNLVPWAVIRDNPGINPEWINNFRMALSSEICELYESSMNGDLDNAKIELIDILHFLVSLSLLVGISYRTAEMYESAEKIHSYDENIVKFFIALDTLQSACWKKWWQKREETYLPMIAKASVRALWARFWNSAYHLNMSLDEIKEIYMAKNRVNYERQVKGYSAEAKTEDDNQAIIAGMSKAQEADPTQ